MAEPICVVGLGASTSIGRNAWSSAAAVRAGISGFTQHPYLFDTAGEPMQVAQARWLDSDLRGVGRLEALLLPAIESALSVLQDRRPKLTLALGLPSERPGLAADLNARLRAAVLQRFGRVFASVALFPQGHAAGLIAVDAACAGIRGGRFDACLVAGVDSYLEPETLEWLEAQDQLHGAGRLNNAWGFIPGEAAGAVLLVGRPAADQFQLEVLAAVRSTGRAIEANRIKTQTVCLGEGLTEAFRQALAGLIDSEQVTDVFCDMNGEPYRADEFGFAALRTGKAFASASDFVAPADCWGDVAAASGPLFIALATIAGTKSYAKGHRAFAWASSEGGDRAAALLQIRGES
jgi:3-oxoacyl-[acyl-carrier-protein] synthase-1